MWVTNGNSRRPQDPGAQEAARFWTTPRAMSSASWSDAWPPVDLYQDGNGIVLEAEVPGVRPQHLEITVEKSRVILEGTRFHRVGDGITEGRAEERFYRVVALPYIVDPEDTQADLRHGVLQVRMARSQLGERRRIPVAVHPSTPL